MSSRKSPAKRVRGFQDTSAYRDLKRILSPPPCDEVIVPDDAAYDALYSRRSKRRRIVGLIRNYVEHQEIPTRMRHLDLSRTPSRSSGRKAELKQKIWQDVDDPWTVMRKACRMQQQDKGKSRGLSAVASHKRHGSPLASPEVDETLCGARGSPRIDDRLERSNARSMARAKSAKKRTTVEEHRTPKQGKLTSSYQQTKAIDDLYEVLPGEKLAISPSGRRHQSRDDSGPRKHIHTKRALEGKAGLANEGPTESPFVYQRFKPKVRVENVPLDEQAPSVSRSPTLRADAETPAQNQLNGCAQPDDTQSLIAQAQAMLADSPLLRPTRRSDSCRASAKRPVHASKAKIRRTSDKQGCSSAKASPSTQSLMAGWAAWAPINRSSIADPIQENGSGGNDDGPHDSHCEEHSDYGRRTSTLRFATSVLDCDARIADVLGDSSMIPKAQHTVSSPTSVGPRAQAFSASAYRSTTIAEPMLISEEEESFRAACFNPSQQTTGSLDNAIASVAQAVFASP